MDMICRPTAAQKRGSLSVLAAQEEQVGRGGGEEMVTKRAVLSPHWPKRVNLTPCQDQKATGPIGQREGQREGRLLGATARTPSLSHTHRPLPPGGNARLLVAVQQFGSVTQTTCPSADKYN